jgi:hypothetical protein
MLDISPKVRYNRHSPKQKRGKKNRHHEGSEISALQNTQIRPHDNQPGYRYHHQSHRQRHKICGWLPLDRLMSFFEEIQNRTGQKRC